MQEGNKTKTKESRHCSKYPNPKTKSIPRLNRHPRPENRNTKIGIQDGCPLHWMLGVGSYLDLPQCTWFHSCSFCTKASHPIPPKTNKSPRSRASWDDEKPWRDDESPDYYESETLSVHWTSHPFPLLDYEKIWGTVHPSSPSSKCSNKIQNPVLWWWTIFWVDSARLEWVEGDLRDTLGPFSVKVGPTSTFSDNPQGVSS